ncbi:MAG: hypothetical protein ACJAS0_003003 [Alcanivorax borkumensis]|jgi:hypothetical protein
MRGQPIKLFPSDRAARTAKPPYRHVQPNLVLEKVTITDSSHGSVVDLLAGLPAMLTPGRLVGVGNQLNQAVRIREVSASGR